MSLQPATSPYLRSPTGRPADNHHLSLRQFVATSMMLPLLGTSLGTVCQGVNGFSLPRNTSHRASPSRIPGISVLTGIHRHSGIRSVLLQMNHLTKTKLARQARRLRLKETLKSHLRHLSVSELTGVHMAGSNLTGLLEDIRHLVGGDHATKSFIKGREMEEGIQEVISPLWGRMKRFQTRSHLRVGYPGGDTPTDGRMSRLAGRNREKQTS